MAFMNIAGCPSVVAVIDETHVRIIALSENEDAYVNRKRYHSINVQVFGLLVHFRNKVDQHKQMTWQPKSSLTAHKIAYV